jgi:1-acyl-sn-glycerol-3-phosphate acyltransferase
MSDRQPHRSRRRWWRPPGSGRRGWPPVAALDVARPVTRRLFRLRVEGAEHVPAAGAAIIAANHLSFFDHVALMLAMRRRLRFLGKAEYLDSWKTRFVLPALGMIPVDRDRPRRALAALDRATHVLRAEEVIAMYPEGTRSRDGSLGAGHTGVAQLSIDSGVSVLPTGIVGTDRIQPPGARLPRPFTPAVVRFGTPIDPAAYRGTRRQRRRAMTSDVMQAIGRLSDRPSADGAAPDRRHAGALLRRGAVITGRAATPPGELVDIDERVVVSPVAGVFTPLTAEGTFIEVGQRIGQVCTRTAVVPVCTPFTGDLVAMAAWDGERVDRRQRVAWVRRRD